MVIAVRVDCLDSAATRIQAGQYRKAPLGILEVKEAHIKDSSGAVISWLCRWTGSQWHHANGTFRVGAAVLCSYPLTSIAMCGVCDRDEALPNDYRCEGCRYAHEKF